MTIWDERIEVAGHRFAPVVGSEVPIGADELPVFKTAPMLRQLADHLESERPRRIVEVGVHLGGSTALLAALAPDATILAIDLDVARPPVWERFVREGGPADGVRLALGVDQADGARLRSLVADTFGGAPIDLVIDDGSHELERSRATLDALLPLVRPGGCYWLEDWSWAHLRAAPWAAELTAARWPEGPSLTLLVHDLVEVVGSDAAVVHRLDLDFAILRAWRGPGELGPDGFDLRRHRLGVEGRVEGTSDPGVAGWDPVGLPDVEREP